MDETPNLESRRKRTFPYRIAVPVVIALVLLGGFVYLHLPWLLNDIFFTDAQTFNHGYSFGYFGTFNRIERAVRTVDGVQVVSTGFNPDWTLEEMVFNYTLHGSEPFALFFEERDPIRHLSGEALDKAVAERIATNTMRPWK